MNNTTSTPTALIPKVPTPPKKYITAVSLIESIMRGNKKRRRIGNRSGHIYLILSSCRTRVKIGKSIDPRERAKNIINTSGGGTHEYTSCMVKDYTAVEYALHKVLTDYRLEGEWFALDCHSLESLVDSICKKFAISATQLESEKQRDRERRAAARKRFIKYVKSFGIPSSPKTNTPDHDLIEQFGSDLSFAMLDALLGARDQAQSSEIVHAALSTCLNPTNDTCLNSVINGMCTAITPVLEQGLMLASTEVSA